MPTGVASASTVAARGFTQAFDNRARGGAPFWPRIARQITSTGADEKYGFLGGMPGMIEWLGDRKFKELLEADYTVVNKDWEQSLLIKESVWQDNRLGITMPWVEALADEAVFHPDELLFQLVVAGETSLCFDGQFYFDTDHSWGNSGPQSNSLTYPAATGTTPTSAEFRLAYNAAYSAMVAFKGDNGKPLYRPRATGSEINPIVCVPTALLPIAADGLNARYDSVGNPITVLGTPELVAIPYLSDATKFYVFNPNSSLPAFVFQARRPLRRQAKGGPDGDIEFQHIKLMVDARYNFGYMAWWNAVLTTFT